MAPRLRAARRSAKRNGRQLDRAGRAESNKEFQENDRLSHSQHRHQCPGLLGGFQGRAVALGYSLLVTVFFTLRLGALICALPLISLLPAWIVTAVISYALTAGLVYSMTKFSLVDDFKVTNMVAAAQGCAVVTITQVALGFVVAHIF
jgi:hypothetical protein